MKKRGRRKRIVQMILGVSIEFSDPFSPLDGRYHLPDFMEGCKDGKYQWSWNRDSGKFTLQNDPEFTSLHNTPGIYSLKNWWGESEGFYIKDRLVL